MTKVLLVEDDNNLREIYEARLAAEGYEISTAKDGEDALAVAKQVKPDLIISDVMMPRISGFEMLDILRNTDGLKHTKIIMLTALGQSEDKSRADNLGADRYLVKSQVTLEDIVKAAEELLNPTASDDIIDTSAPADEAPTTPTAAFSPTAPPDVAAAAHQVIPENGQTNPTTEPTVGTFETTDNPEAAVTSVPDSTPIAPTAAPMVQPAPVDQATPMATPAPTTSEPAPAPQPQPTAPTSTSAMPPEPSAVQPEPVAPPVQPLTDNTAPQPPVAPVTQPVQPLPAEQMTPTTAPTAPVTPTATIVQPSQDPALDASQPSTQMPLATPTDNQQSSSEESAVIAQQIQNFVNADPTQPTSQPQTQPNETIPSNDELIQSAVDTLSSPNATDDNQATSHSQISGKKVIQPINDLSQDSTQLETLLAQEEMQTNPASEVVSAPPADANIAQPQTPVTEVPSMPVAENPTPPSPNSVFMPNQGGNANDSAL